MLQILPDWFGRWLRARRAGIGHVATAALPSALETLVLRSSAFVDGGPLPIECTADGEGISPPLNWTGVPAGTCSLVLIVEDADSPTRLPLVHAVVTGLPGKDGGIEKKFIAVDRAAVSGAVVGRNSMHRRAWLPPDPPPGHGQHRYVFQLVALKAHPPIVASLSRTQLVERLHQFAIGFGTIAGTYQRGSD
jgi:Raf kinase inhibitor-like YbhB/YbcL family protein